MGEAVGPSAVGAPRESGAHARRSLADLLRVRMAVALLAVYLLAVLVVTLTPTPVDSSLENPLTRLIAELHTRGLPAWINYGHLEFASNVLLFVPLGFLAALALPRRAWWLVALLAPVLSAVIEGSQAVFLPERFPSLRDVLANGLGGAIGAVLCLLVRLVVAHRDRLLAADLAAGSRHL